MIIMANLKEIAKMPERISGGHRMCAGCGAPIAVRQILSATKHDVIVANATGCLEVATTIYPYSAWKVPWMHSAFENAASTISGIEAAYRSLKRKGKVKKEIRFVAFGGDGGTYDIGLQALSGALERGHRFVYVCYDNEGYMNTGIQRSSATPLYASTTTDPAGKIRQGKQERRKMLAEIAAAHRIPYVAQTAIHNWSDVVNKATKAFEADGPAFINIFAPCPRGWRADESKTVMLSRLAAETGFWPMFEVENGEWKLNYNPASRKPITEFLKTQGRFKHLFRPENAPLLEKIQSNIDAEWERIKKICGAE